MAHWGHTFLVFTHKGGDMISQYTRDWDRSGLLSKYVLFFVALWRFLKIRFSAGVSKTELGAAYSALSSNRYAIAGTAYAKIKRARHSVTAFFTAPLWLLLGWWCYLRMLPLSDKAVSILGYEHMTADQLDVRQSILRKLKNYEEALRCIGRAVQKEDMSDTSYALLQLGLAECYSRIGKGSSYSPLAMAMVVVRDVETEKLKIDDRQKIRVLKQGAVVAELNGQKHTATFLREKALTLAKNVGAFDQVAKVS